MTAELVSPLARDDVTRTMATPAKSAVAQRPDDEQLKKALLAAHLLTAAPTTLALGDDQRNADLPESPRGRVHVAPSDAPLALQRPTSPWSVITVTANLSPEATIAIAKALGVDASEVPRLIEAAATTFAARGMSFDTLRTEATGLGISDGDTLTILIALTMPERFSAVADFVPDAPANAEQALLSTYVVAVLAEQLTATVPQYEALRFASVAAERLSRLDPRDVFLVAEGIPRLIDAMSGAGRIETSSAIAALVHTAPEVVARIAHDGNEVQLMHAARALIADTHGAQLDKDRVDTLVRGGRLEATRADAVHEADVRGLAVAAALIVLATSASPHEARNLYARAVATVGDAAPRIVLSSVNTRDAQVVATLSADADSDERRREEQAVAQRIEAVLDQLDPFLKKYDQLRAQMVHVNAVPRVDLCNTLHAHLTRGSEQFYVALLSLLRRQSALLTRPGTRALRTALKSRRFDDIIVQSGSVTWTPAA